MTAGLDETTQTNGRVLSADADTSYSGGRCRDSAPVVTAANDEDIVYSASWKLPVFLILYVLEIVSPDREGISTSRSVDS